MDLRQLRYFSVLAETLNFHRAAERLHISQPPLTVAIRKLEEDLGAPLFIRDPRGVRLTEAGRAALPAAHAALAAADQVREVVRQGAAGVRGRLAIGFIGSAIGELLPRVISPFRHAYPEVELALEEMNSLEIAQAIGAGQIDVGFVRLPVIDSTPLAIEVIERDELVIAMRTDDPLSSQPRLDLARLADRPFILFSTVSVLNATIRMACQRAGFAPQVQQEAMQVQTVLSLVEAGLGVALIPARSSRFVSGRLTIARLEQPVPIELGIATAPQQSALVRNFLTTARAVCDSDPVSEGLN